MSQIKCFIPHVERLCYNEAHFSVDLEEDKGIRGKKKRGGIPNLHAFVAALFKKVQGVSIARWT